MLRRALCFILMIRRPPRSTLLPYTTLFRSAFAENHRFAIPEGNLWSDVRDRTENIGTALQTAFRGIEKANPETLYGIFGDRKSTRLNSSHANISYAVFCLKKNIQQVLLR